MSRPARATGGAPADARRQPFCDGSHKVTGFTPVEFKAANTEKVWFCACERSGKKPMCDGTHKTLGA